MRPSAASWRRLLRRLDRWPAGHRWLALMNPKTRSAEPRSPLQTMIGQQADHPSLQGLASARRQRGRGSRENVALQLELTHLTPQPDELLALGRRKRRLDRLGLPATFPPVSLGDPVPDRLGPLQWSADHRCCAGRMIRLLRIMARTREPSPPGHVRSEPTRASAVGTPARREGVFWAWATPCAKVNDVSTQAGHSNLAAWQAGRPAAPFRPGQPGWIQSVVATPSVSIYGSHASSASAGVFQPSVFRGLALRAAATAAIASVECTLRSVPLGKY